VQVVRSEVAKPFSIAKRVYIAVDDDVSRAERRVAEQLSRFYGGADLISVAVFGTPEQCVQGLGEVADAGAELILLNPLFDDAEQMERLAAEVIPHLV
jgi:alkanesulfonate monooxygenase SsuD/methylene tetrahydromethanopterin reductase-like flavin-dependent oxidoreductase (luciferase family)